MLYNLAMPEPSQIRLERVFGQLRLYEHPLLNFSARAKGEGVEIIIEFKDKTVPVHTYYFDMHPRDLDDAAFTCGDVRSHQRTIRRVAVVNGAVHRLEATLNGSLSGSV